MVSNRQLARVRELATSFPAVTERLSHGEPCFFVADTRPLCYFHDDHNGEGRVSLWFPARPGVQDELVAAEPDRFFRPPASSSGVFANWVGLYLDTHGRNKVEWSEIGAILDEAFRLIAPKSLVAELDRRSPE